MGASELLEEADRRLYAAKQRGQEQGREQASNTTTTQT